MSQILGLRQTLNVQRKMQNGHILLNFKIHESSGSHCFENGSEKNMNEMTYFAVVDP